MSANQHIQFFDFGNNDIRIRLLGGSGGPRRLSHYSYPSSTEEIMAVHRNIIADEDPIPSAPIIGYVKLRYSSDHKTIYWTILPDYPAVSNIFPKYITFKLKRGDTPTFHRQNNSYTRMPNVNRRVYGKLRDNGRQYIQLNGDGTFEQATWVYRKANNKKYTYGQYYIQRHSSGYTTIHLTYKNGKTRQGRVLYDKEKIKLVLWTTFHEK